MMMVAWANAATKAQMARTMMDLFIVGGWIGRNCCTMGRVYLLLLVLAANALRDD